MIGLGQNEALLLDAIKKMQQAWERAGAEWHDAARMDFEKEYIRSLDPALRGAVQGLTETRRVLEQAIRECS